MIVLFIIGSVFLLLAIFIFFSEFQTRQGSAAVHGEVVGFRNPNGSGSQFPNFQTVARYSHLNGQTYYALSGTTSNVPQNAVGDRVVVFIRKSDPAFGKIRSRSNLVIATALTGLGAGCLYFFFRVFHWDLFSVFTSAVILGMILRSGWKAKRSIPLPKTEWNELKKGNEKKSVFAEDEKEQIEWVPPESLLAVSANAKAARQKALPFCIVLTVLCAGGSFYLYQKTQHFFERAHSTHGQVVDIVESHSHDGSTYAPMVEFTNLTTHSRQRFRHPVSSNPPAYSVGEEVAILFDPQNPADARIDSGIWNFAFPILLGGVSALFFLITFANLRSLGKYSSPHRRAFEAPRRPPRSA